MRVLDLFSGIGGFSLGLERAGMRTVAFCEIDPYCQAVLRQHWPAVPVWGDVRMVTKNLMAYTFRMRELQSQESKQDEWRRFADGGVDVICGGFPCQDISVAGKGAGITGERSGLWTEFARIIGEVRPKYVIVENVAALLGRGLERVLGDLAALGFDAEWHCIPASAVGAPHRRDRVWIVAYSRSERRQQVAGSSYGDETTNEGRSAPYNHQSAGHGESDGTAVVNTDSQGLPHASKSHAWIGIALTRAGMGAALGNPGWWLVEPDVGRVAHGVPFRVDRLRSLGNAIVPQIAEVIGRAIMAHELSAQHLGE